MPPEDFSQVFTVEVKTEKGWEVVSTIFSVYEASRTFQTFVNSGIEARLTSPTVEVLQKRLSV